MFRTIRHDANGEYVFADAQALGKTRRDNAKANKTSPLGNCNGKSSMVIGDKSNSPNA